MQDDGDLVGVILLCLCTMRAPRQATMNRLLFLAMVGHQFVLVVFSSLLVTSRKRACEDNREKRRVKVNFSTVVGGARQHYSHWDDRRAAWFKYWQQSCNMLVYDWFMSISLQCQIWYLCAVTSFVYIRPSRHAHYSAVCTAVTSCSVHFTSPKSPLHLELLFGILTSEKVGH
jgi:hypothetical protein